MTPSEQPMHECAAPLQSDDLTEEEKVNRQLVMVIGENIRHIENPSEAVQLLAISPVTSNIRFISNPTLKVQLTATSIDGDVVRFIKNPSLEVQLNAVSEYGAAIRFIESPVEEVQIMAVDYDGYHLIQIDPPTIKTIARAIARTPALCSRNRFPEESPLMCWRRFSLDWWRM